MQITDEQFDAGKLAALGWQATQLLFAADFPTFADRFGYALAFGRAPALAIQQEFQASLDELGASGLASTPPDEPRVSYFQVNNCGLLALVEQFVFTDNGRQIHVELIVTGNDSAKYVTLEQISAVT
jgi:hypothetical protein